MCLLVSYPPSSATMLSGCIMSEWVTGMSSGFLLLHAYSSFTVPSRNAEIVLYLLFTISSFFLQKFAALMFGHLPVIRKFLSVTF